AARQRPAAAQQRRLPRGRPPAVRQSPGAAEHRLRRCEFAVLAALGGATRTVQQPRRRQPLVLGRGPTGQSSIQSAETTGVAAGLPATRATERRKPPVTQEPSS